jgi:hypothetical protein
VTVCGPVGDGSAVVEVVEVVKVVKVVKVPTVVEVLEKIVLETVEVVDMVDVVKVLLPCKLLEGEETTLVELVPEPDPPVEVVDPIVVVLETGTISYRFNLTPAPQYSLKNWKVSTERLLVPSYLLLIARAGK